MTLDGSLASLPEFLVRIEVTLPASMPSEQRDELLAAERTRGEELAHAGHLRHIWRVPGRHANVSIYAVTDATELHDALMSLPLAPWMSITAEPLARHPLSEAIPRPITIDDGRTAP